MSRSDEDFEGASSAPDGAGVNGAKDRPPPTRSTDEELERLRKEVAHLKRQLAASRAAARADRRTVDKLNTKLGKTKLQLKEVRGSREMQIGTAATRPLRLLARKPGPTKPAKAPLPTFLIIGAQKAGTRWLRYNLGLHPEIFTPRRELNYFNSPAFHNGLDWYREEYEGWSGEPMVGEATPGYMIWRSDPALKAQRIDEQLPGVRLFAVLRDPCDRVLSAFIHHIRQGRLSPDADLLEYVRAEPPEEDYLQLISGGWYAASLEPFVERFGARLLVFLNEDIRADANGVYRRALEHVGAEATFVPENLAEVRYSTPVPAESKYASKAGERRRLTDEERLALWPYFVEDVERLEALIDRDLSHWRPPASMSSSAHGDEAGDVSR